jgi:hypothetical protein
LPFSRLAQCSFSLWSGCSLIHHRGTFCIEGFVFCRYRRPRSDCFRLQQQLSGGISSSHWISAPFHGARKKRVRARLKSLLRMIEELVVINQTSMLLAITHTNGGVDHGT